MLVLPVSAVPQGKLRDRGSSVHSLISGMEKEEAPVAILPQGDGQGELLFLTRMGMVRCV